jgi:4'-phosphopantetheinyl transferase
VVTPEELASHRWVVLHLARAAVDDASLDGLVSRLAPSELARYRATPLAHGRDTFVIGRSLLRAALAAATGADPKSITFVAEPDGKLSLPGATASFNLSHSPSHFLIGISRHPHVGVDIEDIRPYSERMPERFFRPDEVAHIEGLAPDERPAAFFHHWVIKEACIKAYGRTLGPSLAGVPATMETRGRHGDLSWEVVDVGPDVKAAIALEAPDEVEPTLVRRMTPEEFL